MIQGVVDQTNYCHLRHQPTYALVTVSWKEQLYEVHQCLFIRQLPKLFQIAPQASTPSLAYLLASDIRPPANAANVLLLFFSAQATGASIGAVHDTGRRIFFNFPPRLSWTIWLPLPKEAKPLQQSTWSLQSRLTLRKS